MGGYLYSMDMKRYSEISQSFERKKAAYAELERNRSDFLFNYLIKEDKSWNEPITISCACNSQHKIYPSLWLYYLIDQKWVYENKNDSNMPNAQNLANLFKTNKNELYTLINNDDALNFLNGCLKIGLNDLIKNVQSGTKKEMIKKDVAITKIQIALENNTQGLVDLSEVIQTPGVIDELKKKRADLDRVRRNQKIGSEVEKMIQRVLSDIGFKVEKTGIGSDFSIENDYIEGDEEIGLSIQKNNIKLLLEIKSTRSAGSVKMTLPQAKKAVSEMENFFLCVVPITSEIFDEETIKLNSKFVFDLGVPLKDKVLNAENLKNVEEKTASVSGDINIIIENSQIRFEIQNTIWEKGLSFDEFVNRIKD